MTVGGVDLGSMDLARPFAVRFDPDGRQRSVSEATAFIQEVRRRFPAWEAELDLRPRDRAYFVRIDPTAASPQERIACGFFHRFFGSR